MALLALCSGVLQAVNHLQISLAVNCVNQDAFQKVGYSARHVQMELLRRGPQQSAQDVRLAVQATSIIQVAPDVRLVKNQISGRMSVQTVVLGATPSRASHVKYAYHRLWLK